jgi:DNA (cytosine-5)-methyltransferase 1
MVVAAPVYEMHGQDSRVRDVGEVCTTVSATYGSGSGNVPITLAQSIPFDTTQITSPYNYSNPQAGDPCHPLAAGAHPPAVAQPIAWDEELNASIDIAGTLLRGGAGGRHDGVAQPIVYERHDQDARLKEVSVAPTLHAKSDNTCDLPVVLRPNMAVRRLTPVECERLQGFPDGYTNIPWRKKPESPDGPRYKALGNSWAVPVVAWIGRRIAKEAFK